jgi:hypothetical protein
MYCALPEDNACIMKRLGHNFQSRGNNKRRALCVLFVLSPPACDFAQPRQRYCREQIKDGFRIL